MFCDMRDIPIRYILYNVDLSQKRWSVLCLEGVEFVSAMIATRSK